MSPLLLAVSFLASSLLVIGIYLALTDHASNRGSKQEPAISGANRMAAELQLDDALPQRGNAEVSSRMERAQLWIEQSGLRMSPLLLLMVCGGLGIGSVALVIVLVGRWWAAALTLPVSLIPIALLAIARHQRTDRLRAQLPDALDLMSRMLRAGQTIPQALRGVAEEFESPIADEFGYCYEQQNLGLSTDAAMYEMARRTGTLELRILVVALTVHRQTGGNLSELLDNLAKVIRERYRIQGQIRSLTADGRMQAAILLALPPLLLGLLSVVNQDYVTILYQFPWLLAGMFGFELFGAIWLHRIVSFDF